MPVTAKIAKPLLPGFTPEEHVLIRHAMNRTWEAIAGDILNEVGEMPKSHVIEVVLDADYMNMYGRITKELYTRFDALDYKLRIKFAKTVFTFARYS